MWVVGTDARSISLRQFFQGDVFWGRPKATRSPRLRPPVFSKNQKGDVWLGRAANAFFVKKVSWSKIAKKKRWSKIGF
jgi:hypothetical protein